MLLGGPRSDLLSACSAPWSFCPGPVRNSTTNLLLVCNRQDMLKLSPDHEHQQPPLVYHHTFVVVSACARSARSSSLLDGDMNWCYMSCTYLAHHELESKFITLIIHAGMCTEWGAQPAWDSRGEPCCSCCPQRGSMWTSFRGTVCKCSRATSCSTSPTCTSLPMDPLPRCMLSLIMCSY